MPIPTFKFNNLTRTDLLQFDGVNFVNVPVYAVGKNVMWGPEGVGYNSLIIGDVIKNIPPVNHKHTTDDILGLQGLINDLGVNSNSGTNIDLSNYLLTSTFIDHLNNIGSAKHVTQAHLDKLNSLDNSFKSTYLRALRISSYDANNGDDPGGFVASYALNSWLTNGAFTGYGGLITWRGNSGPGLKLQMQYDVGHLNPTGGRLAFRTSNSDTDNDSYTTWKILWHSGDFTSTEVNNWREVRTWWQTVGQYLKIKTVYGYGNLGQTFNNNTLTDTFNAYTINRLHERVQVLEAGGGGSGGGGTVVSWGTELNGGVGLTVDGITKTLALKSGLDLKQDKLIAGSGITIVGNTISSTATGGGGGTVVSWGTLTNGYRQLTVEGVTYALAQNTHKHLWADITDKPSTFTPSAHTHSAGSIISGTFAIARIPTGTTGTTVALGNHTHTFASLTSKPTTLGGYGITDAVTLNTAQTITGEKTFTGNVILGVNREIQGTDNYAGVWNVDNLLWRFGSSKAGSIANIRSEKVGIGTISPSEKLQVAGNILATGIITSDGFYQSSDIRLKNIIKPLEINIEDILNIPSFYFTYKDKDKDKERINIGTSAQEVQKVFPEIVSTNSKGMLSVEYDKFGLIALDLIKTQQKEIDSLKYELNNLKLKIDGYRN